MYFIQEILDAKKANCFAELRRAPDLADHQNQILGPSLRPHDRDLTKDQLCDQLLQGWPERLRVDLQPVQGQAVF